MIFSPGGPEPRTMRTSCLLGFKSVRWESIHFKGVICKDRPLSFFSFFPPMTPVHMFTPKPFQISTHSCTLTGFYCPEVPLLFWLRIPRSWDSCTLRGSMKSSERAASSPDFPWIRSWHFNEGKDNVWTSASPGSRPSPCHRTPTSCLPHSTSYFSDHQTNRPLNALRAGWGGGCQDVFPASGTRWLQTVPTKFFVVVILFCFYFYEWLWEKMPTEA